MVNAFHNIWLQNWQKVKKFNYAIGPPLPKSSLWSTQTITNWPNILKQCSYYTKATFACYYKSKIEKKIWRPTLMYMVQYLDSSMHLIVILHESLLVNLVGMHLCVLAFNDKKIMYFEYINSIIVFIHSLIVVLK